MDEDISNKTIIVLVVLTVVISLLSSLVVLNEVSNVKLEASKIRGGTSSGKVELTILPRQEKTESAVSGATGRVVLEVLPKKSN